MDRQTDNLLFRLFYHHLLKNLLCFLLYLFSLELPTSCSATVIISITYSPNPPQALLSTYLLWLLTVCLVLVWPIASGRLPLYLYHLLYYLYSQFSLNFLKEKKGHNSLLKDHHSFIKEIRYLTSVYNPVWKDIYILLSSPLTPKEKSVYGYSVSCTCRSYWPYWWYLSHVGNYSSSTNIYWKYQINIENQSPLQGRLRQDDYLPPDRAPKDCPALSALTKLRKITQNLEECLPKVLAWFTEPLLHFIQ